MSKYHLICVYDEESSYNQDHDLRDIMKEVVEELTQVLTIEYKSIHDKEFKGELDLREVDSTPAFLFYEEGNFKDRLVGFYKKNKLIEYYNKLF